MPTPSAPIGLKISSSSASEVILDWNEVDSSDTYNVFRSEAGVGGFGEYLPLNGSPLTEPTFTDSEGDEGKTYLYRVTRIVGADESGYSSGVSACFVDAAERITSYSEGDLDTIFNGEQAKDASYTRFGFPPVSIRVIYDHGIFEADQVGGKSKTSKIQVEAKLSETLYAGNKDSIQIEGINFKVKEVRPNHSIGINVLALSKVAVNV